MAQLSLFLFGPMRVLLGGEPVARFRTQKERALLAYLAVEGSRPHWREALAELFWPERPEGMARATLRQAITGLRRALGDPLDASFLYSTSRNTLQLNPACDIWLDVAAFHAHMRAVQEHPTHPARSSSPGPAPSAKWLGSEENNTRHDCGEDCPVCAQHLQAAVGLYQGDFLDGLSLDDCPEFHEWVLVNREILFRKQMAALQWLAKHFQRAQNYPQALQYAWQQVGLDLLSENARRQLMLLLALSGQRSTALEQYHACRRTLSKELGAEPEVETIRLFEQIRDGHLAASETEAPPPSGAPTPPHNLPVPLTAFVGRQVELARMACLLSSPNCRLLTLTGPGGVGKTRLALQAAWSLLSEAETAARHFPDGIWYIPLADLEPSSDALIAAMAQALHVPLEKANNLKAVLLESLRKRKVLLIFDNAESQPEAGDLFLEILQAAPGVACLVTSHIRLNYQAEFMLEVEGLPYPAVTDGPANTHDEIFMAQYPAMQLFMERAARTRAGVPLPQQDLPHIAHICQLLDGLPLGIELAAANTSVHSSAQIVEQIHHDLDALTVSFRDLPSRQRSLRVVFEHSWHLLTPAEQANFRQLAVFRGGFNKAAAEHVVGDYSTIISGQAEKIADRDVSITDHLKKLAVKSLLQVNAAERYDLHAVLKPYAAEKLAEDRGHEQAVRTRHSHYYLGFLRQMSAQFKDGRAKEALEELQPELNNLRAAWEWEIAAAARTGDVGEISASLDGLARYYEFMGLYQEAETIFGGAAQRLTVMPENPDVQRLVNRLCVEQVRFLMRRGLFAQTVQAAHAAFEAALASGDVANQARVAACWGEALFRQGDNSAALERLGHAAALARQIGDKNTEADSLNSMAAICWRQGNYTGAQMHLEQVLSLAAHGVNQQLEGRVLSNLGVLAFEQGNYTEARGYYQRSIQVRQALADLNGESIGHMNLGTFDLNFGAYADARQHYERALAIHRQMGAREKEGWTVGNLGLLAYLRGENEAALEQIRQAMAIAQETGERPMQAVMWLKLGLVLTRLGRLEEAIAAHQTSIELRRALGLTNPLMESCAGLAEALLAQGKPGEALSVVEEVLNHLSNGSLDGTIDPFQIHLTCFQVLKAQHDPRAPATLQAALSRLNEQAERISDLDLRRSFLENVPSHQALRTALGWLGEPQPGN